MKKEQKEKIKILDEAKNLIDRGENEIKMKRYKDEINEITSRYPKTILGVMTVLILISFIANIIWYYTYDYKRDLDKLEDTEVITPFEKMGTGLLNPLDNMFINEKDYTKEMNKLENLKDSIYEN